MAKPAEVNSSVVVTMEFRCADGKVSRVTRYEGATAVKVANLLGDLFDLVKQPEGKGESP